MTEKKRILILTADAGFGHRSAANAVAAAMEEKYGDVCDIDVASPLDDKRSPFFLRDVGNDYEKIIRNMPELYKFEFEASNYVVPTALLESVLVVFLYEIMRDVMRSYRPDVILSTYPLFQAPLSAVFSISRHYVPFYTMVTDLATVHRIWFNKNVDQCLVPTSLLAELAVQSGMPPEKVRVTGMPVNPEVVRETRGQEEIRRDLGWRTDLTTLLAVGSRRVENLYEALNVINHFGAPMQLVVVTGGDGELYQALEEVVWHLPAVHLYEYSNIVPTMMHAADAVICKAGGLVVTESLACGRPMMLVSVIAGQETGNAEYVLQNGAGDLATNPLDVLEVLAHWMADDGRLLKLRAKNAANLGMPYAAYEISDLLYDAAQRGSLRKPRRRISDRPLLVELLSRNKVDVSGRPSPRRVSRRAKADHYSGGADLDE